MNQINLDNNRKGGRNRTPNGRPGKLMNEPKMRRVVEVKMNGEFISIKTCSGYFNFLDDPEVPERLLLANTSEEEIGRTLLDALSRSRILNPKENREFFSFERAGLRYEEWVKKIMRSYGYKTRRAMFLNLKHCRVRSEESQIIFGPTNHVKLEAWERNKSDGIEDVVIPITSLPSEVGAALKETFNRCG